MRALETIVALREYRKSLKESVGFVPTMGALHRGHQSLIERSLKENSHTIYQAKEPREVVLELLKDC